MIERQIKANERRRRMAMQVRALLKYAQRYDLLPKRREKGEKQRCMRESFTTLLRTVFGEKAFTESKDRRQSFWLLDETLEQVLWTAFRYELEARSLKAWNPIQSKELFCKKEPYDPRKTIKASAQYQAKHEMWLNVLHILKDTKRFPIHLQEPQFYVDFL